MNKLFAALVLVAASAVPAPAHAAACDGVTVVVDYRGLGGGVRTGCAAGSPGTGLEALSAAGFGYTFAARQPGFVCRINGKPGTDTEPCVNTPPTSAYWSYWHGQPGGAWSYSSAGAGSHRPNAGVVEGWAFGAGEQPGTPPPAAAPKPPAPAPVNPPPQQPGVPPPPPPPAQTPGQTPSAGPTTTSPTTESSAASSSSSSATSTAESSSAQVSTAPLANQSSDSGSWLGLAIGALVIAVLGGLAFWTARRRSRTQE